LNNLRKGGASRSFLFKERLILVEAREGRGKMINTLVLEDRLFKPVEKFIFFIKEIMTSLLK